LNSKEFPSLDMPIVCDMSSDISRVLDFSKFDIIYAGAQKNYISYQKKKKVESLIPRLRKHIKKTTYTCCISSLCFFINFTMVEEMRSCCYRKIK
jgi:hypothetical protein